jgi:2-methylcitrate dehydratase PrpD
MPYNIARHLLDGSIYLDSFVKEKYMDPKARDLMSKITARPLLDRTVGGGTVLTVRKKNGEQKTFMGGPVRPMSHDDLIQKHDRIADFMQIEKQQRDRTRAQWMDLHGIKDIGEAMQAVAKFGQPRPLSDRTPARIS